MFTKLYKYFSSDPRPPVNLRVVFSTVNCSHVNMTWDSPTHQCMYYLCIYEGYYMYDPILIPLVAATGYIITLTDASESIGGVQTFFSATESLELTTLTCCNNYSYTVSAPTAQPNLPVVSSTALFRTRPDLTGRLRSYSAYNTVIVCRLHVCMK
jgi:hypothetical protein